MTFKESRQLPAALASFNIAEEPSSLLQQRSGSGGVDQLRMQLLEPHAEGPMEVVQMKTDIERFGAQERVAGADPSITDEEGLTAEMIIEQGRCRTS